MCGRLYLTATPAEIRKQFKVEKVRTLVPRYNIAPTQSSPIVVTEGKGRGLHMARWGLVPSWSRDLSLGSRTINARAETLEEKSAFSTPFESQRCLCRRTAFMNGNRRAPRSNPTKIALRSGALIAFAGLWGQMGTGERAGEQRYE
jgi:putative SOS response-associated peptidase YedK